MKRIQLFVLLAILSLIVAGVALSQEPRSFEFVAQIGQPAPRGVIYDRNFDRFALVDTRGRLLLASAQDYSTQHVLYEEGNTFNTYTFSHNGHWFAVAIGRRIDVWDANSGTLVTTFEPDGALSVTAPVQFSDDDGLILFNAVVPAPDSIRRSENDTANLPWLYEFDAARDVRNSMLYATVCC
jgi:hypothetical protein